MSAPVAIADAAPALAVGRVVVKIGSALLVDQRTGLRAAWLEALAADLARRQRAGTRIVVVSSGAIALGRAVMGLGSGPLRLEAAQAAAAVGQIELARAWSEALRPHGVVAGQVLLTLSDTEGRSSRRSYLNARDTLDHLIRHSAVPIVNENDTVATSEIRYGDNDRLAARVATMVRADTLVLLSDVDGLYTAPPAQGGGRLVPRVDAITPEIEAMAGDAGSGLSRGGMRTKVEAARIATGAGTAMIIASGRETDPLARLERGANHTLFAAGEGARARKAWIGGQLRPSGRLVVDDGAVGALGEGRSLLPIGVTRVEGTFARGDVVEIADRAGRVLGHGLAAYNARDAALITGVRSGDIAARLGYEGRAALVHRDDMMIAPPGRDGNGDASC